jgi:hypothetical protein
LVPEKVLPFQNLRMRAALKDSTSDGVHLEPSVAPAHLIFVYDAANSFVDPDFPERFAVLLV